MHTLFINLIKGPCKDNMHCQCSFMKYAVMPVIYICHIRYKFIFLSDWVGGGELLFRGGVSWRGILNEGMSWSKGVESFHIK